MAKTEAGPALRATMITLRPTETYQISLPDDVLQQLDARVTSYWRPRSHTALQLSSNVRDSGIQISAQQRLKELKDRMAEGDSTWTQVDGFPADWCPDAAAAMVTKPDGWVWTHAYLVWPDLAVHATVSKPPYEDSNSDGWAMQAVKSIRRTSVNCPR